jgi:tetratricopeptide (TPR) repeat protein
VLERFAAELKRRRVPQVAGFYLAAGWLAFEVSESVFPRLGLPDWTVTFVLLLLLIGFPLAVGLAWFYDVGPGGVRRTGPAPEETPSAPARPAPPVQRIAVIGAVAVLALAGASFVLLRDGGEPAVELAPDALVVLPFTVRGGEDVEVLAEGMVELLSAKLDGAGELRSVDPHTVLSSAARGDDPDEARRLAARLGAGHYVLGSVLEFGGDLRLQAAIYRTGGGRDPVAEASVEGPADGFLALVDRLAAELLVDTDLAPPGRMPRIAALTTGELPALKQFLEGERALRETRYADAIGHFERATETDSAFALAYYRMAVAASWAERPSLKERALDDAIRHQDRLSERDRDLQAAFQARARGHHVDAQRRYRAIVASHPADLEAWYELGEVMLHSGHVLGIPIADAAEPFARAASFDPGYAATLFHLSNVAAWVGDTARVDSITGALRANLGGRAPPQIEAQWAMIFGDPALQDSVLDATAGDSSSIAFAAWGAWDAAGIRRVAGTAARVEAPLGILELTARTMAGFGLRDEALDWLDGIESRAGLPPIRTSTLAVEPSLRTPPARLRDLRDRLLAWDPGPVRTAPIGPEEWHDVALVQPQFRLYLIALLDAALGMPGEAIRRADDLEALDGAPEIRALAADLATHVRARVHFDQGRPEEALRILETATFWDRSPWDERFSAIFAFRGPALLRADALDTLGRHREALRWFSAFPQGRHTNGFGLYRRAQQHEAIGETDRAAELYARFLDVWTDAEPDLQDLADDARRRLGALTGEG